MNRNQAGLLTIAGILIVSGFLVTPIANAAGGNGFDNFEDDTIGQVPTAGFYVYTATATQNRVVSTQSFSPTHSVQITTVGITTGEGKFNTNPNNVCNTPTASLSFRFRLASLAFGAGNGVILGWTGGSGGNGVEIDSDGTVKAHSTSQGPTTQNIGADITGLTIAINTWYRVEINQITCNGTGNLVVTFPDLGLFGTVSNPTGVTTMDTVTYGERGAVTRQTIWIDDLTVSGFSGTMSASATATVTGLTGFDVDPAANTVIARTDSGANVRTFGALSLTQNNVVATPNCVINNNIDGVAAINSNVPDGLGGFSIHEFVTFTDCDSGHSVVALNIRDGTLGPPFQSALCTEANGGNFCHTTQTYTSGNPGGLIFGDRILVPSAMRQLGSLNTARWDWSKFQVTDGSECSGSTTCPNYALLSWGYTDANAGKLGIFAIAQNNNNPDDSVAVTDQIDTSASPSVTEACFWTTPRNGTFGLDHIAGIAATNTLAVDNAVVGSVFHTFLADYFTPTASLQRTKTMVSSFGTMNGLDCKSSPYQVDGRDLIIISNNAGNIYLIQATGPNGGLNAAGYPITVSPAPTTGSIALSNNLGLGRQYFVFSDGTNLRLYNATSRVLLATGTTPTGTVQDIIWDDAAQNFWVGTTTQIKVYPVCQFTTITCISEGSRIDRNGHPICVAVDNGGISSDCSGVSDAERNATGSLVDKTPQIANDGCGDHFTGTIKIGTTYVPILDWTNCASMAVETLVTILIVVIVIGALQIRSNGGFQGVGAGGITIGAGAAYLASIYVWRAPYQILIPIVAVAVAIIFLQIRSRGTQ